MARPQSIVSISKIGVATRASIVASLPSQVVRGLGNLGLKPYTLSNFRHNLIELSGSADAGPDFLAHHIIPKPFASQAQHAGVNVHDPTNGMLYLKATY